MKYWRKHFPTKHASLSHTCVDLKSAAVPSLSGDLSMLIKIQVLNYPQHMIKCLWQVQAQDPHWHVCRQGLIEEQVGGEQMFFQTTSSTETMLFFWLVVVKTWLYSVQYHVSKNLVEQSYRGNRPKVRDQRRFSVFRQHREQSPSPTRRDMAISKQIIV